MGKLKKVTFQLSVEDLDQLVKMLDVGSYKYTLGQRNIYENFIKIQKDLRNSV